MRKRAVLALTAALIGSGPQAPAQLVVSANQTIVVVESSGVASEPSASATLMFGFQGPAATHSNVATSSVPYFSGGTNATGDQVRESVERVRNVVGDPSVVVHGDLVRTLGSPEFLGKVTVTLAHPTAKQIDHIIESLVDQRPGDILLRPVGVWFHPTTSCGLLSQRADANGQRNAMSDIISIGRAIGMRASTALLVQERAIQRRSSAFLCNDSTPKLPLNIMESPEQWNSGVFLMRSAQVVAYSMSALPGAPPHERTTATSVGEARYASGPSFVQVHLPASGTAISSMGGASARVDAQATLVAFSTYSQKNNAVVAAMRANGYDAASVETFSGQSLVGAFVRSTASAEIEKIVNALRETASENGTSFGDTVQAVPFARECASERDAVLRKATAIAQENDAHLAALAGRRLERPLAIIEENSWQDVMCGEIPADAARAFERLDAGADYGYVPSTFDRIHASVKAVYEAR